MKLREHQAILHTERNMIEKLAVGLQAVCLCVVVGFFATEIVVKNAKDIVGGCPTGIATTKCSSTTTRQCPSASGKTCPANYTYSDCTSGTGGACTNGASEKCRDDRCKTTTECSCSSDG